MCVRMCVVRTAENFITDSYDTHTPTPRENTHFHHEIEN